MSESATTAPESEVPNTPQSGATAGQRELKEFKHPPIIMDLLFAFKQWYGMHQHLPKLFRITISTKMMEALSECIELAVMVNFGKPKLRSETREVRELEMSNEKLLELRGKIELLKAYSLVSWEMKFISHGFYGQYSERIENISKQAAAWHQWMTRQK